MLHVSIDLVPHGVEGLRTTLTDLYIGNDGTGTSAVGNYDVYTVDPRETPIERDPSHGKRAAQRKRRPGWIGRIEGFDRELGRNALAACAIALLDAPDARCLPDVALVPA